MSTVNVNISNFMTADYIAVGLGTNRYTNHVREYILSSNNSFEIEVLSDENVLAISDNEVITAKYHLSDGSMHIHTVVIANSSTAEIEVEEQEGEGE